MATSQSASATTIEVPYKDEVVTEDNKLSPKWQYFFRVLQKALSSLGTEKSFQLVNEQVLPENIQGLSFSSSDCSQVIVDYFIQRVTTGTNPVELIETGTFHLVYQPTSNAWVKFVASTLGSASGVTLTVTAAGQVQYTSTLVDGTASLSRITYRARTMSAKSSIYSRLGVS